MAQLIGNGLCRAEVVGLSVEDVQLRLDRWLIPALLGQGGRSRTITVTLGFEARIDPWIRAAGISEGRLYVCRSADRTDNGPVLPIANWAKA